jgi:hypothetical protein
MAFGTTVERAILDAWFGGTAPSLPATLYFGLSTTTISNAAGPTEPSGGAYARVASTNNATNWPAATGNTPAVKKNANAITFPTSTASWGNCTDGFVADAASAGTVLAFGVLSVAVNVTGAGFTVSFAANAVTINQT